MIHDAEGVSIWWITLGKDKQNPRKASMRRNQRAQFLPRTTNQRGSSIVRSSNPYFTQTKSWLQSARARSGASNTAKSVNSIASNRLTISGRDVFGAITLITHAG